MNAGWMKEVSLPVDALSKVDSGAVYYDPSQLRDTIKQELTQDKGKKRWGLVRWGESEMSPSLSVSPAIS